METANDYHDQANEFLTSAGITFEAKFFDHAKHFPDDKETRDIYDCIFRRVKSGSEFRVRFGQSIHNSRLSPERQRAGFDRHHCHGSELRRKLGLSAQG